MYNVYPFNNGFFEPLVFSGSIDECSKFIREHPLRSGVYYLEPV